MKRAGVALAVAAILVVGIVLAWRAEPVQSWTYRRVLGEPKPKQYAVWPGVTVSAKGPKQLAAAKTAITSGAYGGTCTFYFQVPAGTDEGPQAMNAFGGGMSAIVGSVIPSDQEGKLKFHRILGHPGSPGPIDDYVYVDIPEEGNPPTQVRWVFTWSVSDAILKEELTSNPIGDKGATHAKESEGADSWWGPDDCTGACSFDTLSYSGLLGSGLPGVFGMTIGGASFDPDNWTALGKYAVAYESIGYCGYPCDLSGYTARNFGGVSGLWVEGVGDKIGFWATQDYPIGYYTWGGGTVNAPYHHDLSAVHVVDMEGVDLADLDLWCCAVRERDGSGNDIGPTKKTLAEWQAYSHIQQNGLGTLSGTGDPELTNAFRLIIDPTSGRAHLLEGMSDPATFDADSYAPSFADDMIVEVEGWDLACTSREVDSGRADIASLTHRDGVGLYGPGPAHDHEDWVPTNCTAPDVDGYFTVNSPGGSLKLTLASNYIARQGYVGDVGAISVPDAYRVRQADFFLGTGLPSPGGEPNEAVYSWLDWGYLYTLFDAPEAAEVTMALEFYANETCDDTHLSDASRQTDYTYAQGALSALSYVTPVAAGVAESCCFDLSGPEALVLVKSMTFTFSKAGAWRLQEPTLYLDVGDAQATPARAAPVTDAISYKQFEHFAYLEGGLSGHCDGMFQRAVWCPDNYLANTLERTVGNLNPLYGAETGEDLTTVFTAEALVGLAEAAADALTAGYSAANDEARYVDVDSVRLKVPTAADIRTMVHGVSFLVNPRTWKWMAAPGLKYVWHTYKVVEGRAHGRATVSDTNERARSRTNFAQVWRRQQGSANPWVSIGLVNSDEHGHWTSMSAEVIESYPPAGAVLYEYDVGEVYDPASPLGRLATREWAFRDVEVPYYWDPFLEKAPVGGLVWRVASTGQVAGNVHCHYADARAVPFWTLTPAKPFTGNFGRPSIAVEDDGALLVCATNRDTGDMEFMRSRDGGTTWAVPA